MEPTTTQPVSPQPGDVVAPTEGEKVPVNVVPKKPTPPADTVAQALEADAPDVVSVMQELSQVKSGYKTTEFWVTLLVNVATLAGAVYPNNSTVVRISGLVVSVVNTVAYLAGRVAVKKHAATLAANTVQGAAQ